MRSSVRRLATILAALLVAGVLFSPGAKQSRSAPDAEPSQAEPGRVGEFTRQFCTDCHNREDQTAGLALDNVGTADISRNPELWERVVRKLSSGQMPPPGTPRPGEEQRDAVVSHITSLLDAAAAARPRPGRTATFRRMTRTEYRNAIRDLLALDVDVSTLLPSDELSHGFDNVTVTELSPTLLDRYVGAAQKISRMTVGGVESVPAGETFRVPADVTQDVHVAGLPLGTRGGILIPYTFPRDGDYDIQVHLMRDRNDEVEGLKAPHELEVLLDRERAALLTVAPPQKGETNDSVDANLKARVHVTAGPHDLGVTFVKQSSSLLETRRQPLNVHFNFYRHPRLGPAVYEVTITGPFDAADPGDTPSRRKFFISTPTGPADEESCAEQILSHLMRRAYRRPVTADDLQSPLALYRQGRANADFDAGIELALSSVLVNPQFLFRIERDPQGVTPGEAYRVSDLELASRLSFFLWSSIPDEQLLQLAERGELSRPDVLAAQTRRMLADDRSHSFVDNFAAQWLHLRNLDAAMPDMRLFPDFDDNLRHAFRQETELLFAGVIHDDRSVLDLIRSDSTFLNERLAKHYGIPHVYGSRFRCVTLSDDSHRGGLLRHGSILTVTSYATRTSPVLRGKWVLENLLGSPPPPPPENVPALDENMVAAGLPVRERLARHRADEACASCHNLIDPVGFSLENFDAVGRWRDLDAGEPVDASGAIPGGEDFTGVKGLEKALLERPELFVRTLTEKLMTYALGRGVEDDDAPSIRRIVADARDADYCFSSLIVGIVQSTPFQMREAE
jgi:hypothetical protein